MSRTEYPKSYEEMVRKNVGKPVPGTNLKQEPQKVLGLLHMDNDAAYIGLLFPLSKQIAVMTLTMVQGRLLIYYWMDSVITGDTLRRLKDGSRRWIRRTNAAN